MALTLKYPALLEAPDGALKKLVKAKSKILSEMATLPKLINPGTKAMPGGFGSPRQKYH
jgi:hypothetical protein